MTLIRPYRYTYRKQTIGKQRRANLFPRVSRDLRRFAQMRAKTAMVEKIRQIGRSVTGFAMFTQVRERLSRNSRFISSSRTFTRVPFIKSRLLSEIRKIDSYDYRIYDAVD